MSAFLPVTAWSFLLTDLSLHPVQCISDCETLMKKGWQNRATASTLMNTDSSRSHSIFSMHLEMMPYNGFECDLQVSCNAIKKGKLNLVDLAGSERQAKTGKYSFHPYKSDRFSFLNVVNDFSDRCNW